MMVSVVTSRETRVPGLSSAFWLDGIRREGELKHKEKRWRVRQLLLSCDDDRLGLAIPCLFSSGNLLRNEDQKMPSQ